MTLTEQLATESLPEYTEFYVRKKDGSTDTQTWLNRRHSSAVEWWNTFNITEVLAPVPSYEEWQRTFHYAGKYEHEYTSCVMEYENLKQENQQLKELLLVCREMLDSYQYSQGDYTIGDNAEIDTSLLLKMIDKAIGEK